MVHARTGSLSILLLLEMAMRLLISLFAGAISFAIAGSAWGFESIPGYAPKTGEFEALTARKREDAPATRHFRLRIRDSGEKRFVNNDVPSPADFESLLGIGIASVERIRLGAFAIKSSSKLTKSAVAQMLSRWNRDPSILWIEWEATGLAAPDIPARLPAGDAEYIIVKATDESVRQAATSGSAPVDNFDSRLSASAGLALVHHAAMSGEAHVYRLPVGTSYPAAWAATKRLESSGLVEFADVSTPNEQHLVPNDPLFSQQWNYGLESSSNRGGIGLTAAWDVTIGSSSVVVAVIDSGIAAGHPEFVSRLVSGYDFVSDSTNSGDGGGRDADATDPGQNCGTRAPVWHGTHVAGTIGAATNNGVGVAGVAPGALIQPVRTQNICGQGSTQDIADAIVWAAGGNVPNAPSNGTPAKVINLSLGAERACPSIYQQAIDTALARGAVVVVSAGNDAGKDVSLISPANCSGVIRVAAHTKFGEYANYTNIGRSISISAPGGQTSLGPPAGSDGGILSTIGGGYGPLQGTSMAAPHVSGVVALVRSAFPAYTVGDVAGVLRSSARQFPYSSDCYATGLCGPGMLDAQAAVRDAVILRIGVVGSGSIASNPSGITCTDACSYNVPYALGQVTLTATPTPGYTFRGWTGDWSGACSGTAACVVSLEYAKTVFAVFVQPGSLQTVSIARSGNGSGGVSSTPLGINCGSSCSSTFSSGTTLTLYASPKTGSEFAGWSGGCSGLSATCVVTVNGPISVTAAFRSLDDYADTAAQAFSVGANSSTQGNLFSSTDVDWFRIALPGPGTWTINSTGSTDTIVDVYAPDGVTLFGSDDDSGGGGNFRLVFTVPNAQTVLVKVRGYSDPYTLTTGPYTLVSAFTAGAVSGVNYTGLWWIPNESGWGINTNHQGDVLFATLFDYASDGQALWLVASNLARQPDGSFTGQLFRTRGPPYYTAPWTASAVVATAVGTMTWRFNSATSAQLVYTFEGRTVTKNVVRQEFAAPVPTCTSTTASRSSETNYQDLWWGGSTESGWGINFTHQGSTIFGTLFTYDNTGRDVWVFSSMPRQPDGSFSGQMFIAAGPPYFTVPWTSITTQALGTMTFRPSAGDRGTLTYNVDTTQVVKFIQRQDFGLANRPVCR